MENNPPVLDFEHQEAWEEWLSLNHREATDVWLRIAKKGSAIRSITHAEALDSALCFGWIDAHKKELGISHVIAEGESGGGNLSIATTMKLIRDGKGHIISGTYALCPYISGMYDASPEKLAEELPSLLEFDGYFLSTRGCDLTGWGYTPEGPDRTNPAA